MKYSDGIYRIVSEPRGWCVARINGFHENGEPFYHRISRFYEYRGWAQNFVRRRRIKVENYFL
jgi:hypothetical protein